MTSCKFCETATERISSFLMLLIIISFFYLSSSAYAAEITYTGDGKGLQDAPVWFPTHPTESLFPGIPEAPLSIGNKVIINYSSNGSEMTTNPEFVFGGLSKLGEAANNNSIVMSGGHVYEDMYGGWSFNGEAVNNTVVVNGGNVADSIYGGWSKDGAARENSVAVSDSRIGISVLGAHSVEGDVINNTLTLRDISAGNVGGGWSYKGDADGNTVAVGGDSAISNAFGGMSVGGSATGNKLTLSFGMVYDSVYGGMSGNGDGNVVDNAVVVTSGVVLRAIYGGLNLSGDATGNTVTVSGGIECYLVYGGAAVSGNATGNTVTINGRPRGVSETRIFGGYTDEDSADSFSGNILKLNSSGVSVLCVSNFEYYDFDFSEDLTSDTVILSVDEAAELVGTTVKISLQGGSMLHKGDKIALIHSAEGVSGSPKNKSCQVRQGGLIYEFSIYTDSKNLWAAVTKISSAAR